MSERRYHDLGGLEAGPIDPRDKPHEPWENRVRALYGVLVRQKGLLSTDEMRRGIEDFSAAEYDSLSYYERWAVSMARILIEKGVVHVDELGREMAEVEQKWLSLNKG